MDCMEPDVVAPGEDPDGGKTSIKSEAQDGGKTLANDEAQDDGKTLVNGDAEQACHNVSVPLFTAK